jgi:hypothetical protein
MEMEFPKKTGSGTINKMLLSLLPGCLLVIQVSGILTKKPINFNYWVLPTIILIYSAIYFGLIIMKHDLLIDGWILPSIGALNWELTLILQLWLQHKFDTFLYLFEIIISIIGVVIFWKGFRHLPKKAILIYGISLSISILIQFTNRLEYASFIDNLIFFVSIFFLDTFPIIVITYILPVRLKSDALLFLVATEPNLIILLLGDKISPSIGYSNDPSIVFTNNLFLLLPIIIFLVICPLLWFGIREYIKRIWWISIISLFSIFVVSFIPIILYDGTGIDFIFTKWFMLIYAINILFSPIITSIFLIKNKQNNPFTPESSPSA